MCVCACACENVCVCQELRAIIYCSQFKDIGTISCAELVNGDLDGTGDSSGGELPVFQLDHAGSDARQEQQGAEKLDLHKLSAKRRGKTINTRMKAFQV